MSLGRLGDEMGAIANPEFAELSRELAAVLPPEHELFAASVAAGMSYRESAKHAGFHEDNGFRLMQMPRIRARVEELVSVPDERIRARVNAEFLILLNRVSGADDKSYDPDLHLRVLLALAKYKGWIVDKKQVAKLSASVRLDRAELDAALEADLERLAPGATDRLARLGRAPSRSDLARIAVGEDGDPAGAEE
jgi:hypothetical protein